MVLLEILSAHSLAAVPIPPAGGSANSSLCIVSCRHLEKARLKHVFSIFSILDLMIGL
jgi:hypothetical protein